MAKAKSDPVWFGYMADGKKPVRKSVYFTCKNAAIREDGLAVKLSGTFRPAGSDQRWGRNFFTSWWNARRKRRGVKTWNGLSLCLNRREGRQKIEVASFVTSFCRSGPMTKAERIQVYKKLLREEGFKPRLDAEGNLKFKFEGQPYIIEVEEGDEEFFRLAFRNFWVFDKASDHLGALIGALHATAETKVAKVCVIDGEVVASIELFLGSARAFPPRLPPFAQRAEIRREPIHGISAGKLHFHFLIRWPHRLR